MRQTMKSLVVAGLFMTSALASPVIASESGAVNVRVTIPPIAATRLAVAEGAVGAWTVTRPSGGLLLAIKSSSRDQSELVVYRSDRNFLLPTFADRNQATAMGLSLKTSTVSSLNGLQRTSYAISASESADRSSPVVLILRSL